jgi:hypothetical protein
MAGKAWPNFHARDNRTTSGSKQWLRWLGKPLMIY